MVEAGCLPLAVRPLLCITPLAGTVLTLVRSDLRSDGLSIYTLKKGRERARGGGSASATYAAGPSGQCPHGKELRER